MFSDEELFEKVVRTDDQNAFEELVIRYRLPATRYVAKLIHDNAYAEHLSQNVFANIYFKRKRLYPIPHFKAYLFKALKNQSIDWLRKTQRIQELDIETITIPMEEVQATGYLKELKTHLPAKDYQLVMLRGYYGFSFKEIAQLMQLSPGNARIRWSRLKWKLRGIKE
ncbi:RNA polymerase sigma factor [Pediococcus siamensis]|uniref:RNA polymerase sigma factor n=1 Tax=Pediococcus siamensis TaxID=381829 RepID=UPI00399FBED6